jgi:hypothetical protein
MLSNFFHDLEGADAGVGDLVGYGPTGFAAMTAAALPLGGPADGHPSYAAAGVTATVLRPPYNRGGAVTWSLPPAMMPAYAAAPATTTAAAAASAAATAAALGSAGRQSRPPAPVSLAQLPVALRGTRTSQTDSPPTWQQPLRTGPNKLEPASPVPATARSGRAGAHKGAYSAMMCLRVHIRPNSCACLEWDGGEGRTASSASAGGRARPAPTATAAAATAAAAASTGIGTGLTYSPADRSTAALAAAASRMFDPSAHGAVPSPLHPTHLLARPSPSPGRAHVSMHRQGHGHDTGVAQNHVGDDDKNDGRGEGDHDEAVAEEEEVEEEGQEHEEDDAFAGMGEDDSGSSAAAASARGASHPSHSASPQSGAHPRYGGQRGLLSEHAKRQNHINSEKKRRLNIHEAFQTMSALVPALRGTNYSKATILTKANEYITSLQQRLGIADEYGNIIRDEYAAPPHPHIQPYAPKCSYADARPHA